LYSATIRGLVYTCFALGGGAETLMKNVRKHFHFWFLAVVLATFIIVSAASLAGLGWVVIEDNFTFTYASIVIPVFFASVILAVRGYGLKVALTVCSILGISMMILVLTSPQSYSNLHGTIIVMAIGVGAICWIDRDRKNRERHEQSAEEIGSRIAELQQELLGLSLFMIP